MAERVGIVAVAQTKYSEARRDVKQEELGYEAVKQVRDETGLKFTNDGTGIDASILVIINVGLVCCLQGIDIFNHHVDFRFRQHPMSTKGRHHAVGICFGGVPDLGTQLRLVREA